MTDFRFLSSSFLVWGGFNHAVRHGILFQRAGLALYAEIDERGVARAADGAADGRFHLDNRTGGGFYFVVAKREHTVSADDDIHFLVLKVMMAEGERFAGGDGAEGYFYRGGANHVLDECLAFEFCEIADAGGGITFS